MIYQLNEQDLKDACFQLAKDCVCKTKPSYMEIQALADEFFSDAISFEEDIHIAAGDPNMITRAVRYLHESSVYDYAVGEIEGFYSLLLILLEIACPNILENQHSHEFFKDLSRGMDSIHKMSIQNVAPNKKYNFVFLANDNFSRFDC